MNADMRATLNKKNNGTGKPFRLTGMKTVADLVNSTDEEENTPPAPTAPTTSIFIDLLGQARKGGRNFVSPEKKKEHQQKVENYERAHRRPGEVRMPGREIQQPTLPSPHTLQNLGRALQDGSAFKNSTGRPVLHSHRETPTLPKTHGFDASFYACKSTRRLDNSSQVSFCEHQDLLVDWDPIDPDNKRGSWRLSMRDYFRSPPEHEDHKSCPAPNLQNRSKVLAQRIIQKFTDMENGRLTTRDRRDGKEPRRPPPFNLVEREILTMIQHMSWGKNKDIVEKREAARLKMKAREGKRKTDAKVMQQATQKPERVMEAALDIEDSDSDEDPVVAKPKKMVRHSTELKSSASSPQQRIKVEKRKTAATIHTQRERRPRIGEKIRVAGVSSATIKYKTVRTSKPATSHNTSQKVTTSDRLSKEQARKIPNESAPKRPSQCQPPCEVSKKHEASWCTEAKREVKPSKRRTSTPPATPPYDEELLQELVAFGQSNTVDVTAYGPAKTAVSTENTATETVTSDSVTGTSRTTEANKIDADSQSKKRNYDVSLDQDSNGILGSQSTTRKKPKLASSAAESSDSSPSVSLASSMKKRKNECSDTSNDDGSQISTIYNFARPIIRVKRVRFT
ncbi:hypothetical protein BKA66DRAFT_448417 [Pyrenochaeta sp. MPI-SDFR-AT-0127]|nr:hypothetical protein BKA66DRAFT_448417 [Pyrenochaeta sp. MPI-SDFR-AT-0127]